MRRLLGLDLLTAPELTAIEPPRERRVRIECDDRVVRYVMSIERFTFGELPMVCARSGREATKLIPVQARRTSAWPWFLFPLSVIGFLVAKWVADSDHPWGRLPFAEGHVGGVEATYDKRIGVILDGLHPDFVAALRR